MTVMEVPIRGMDCQECTMHVQKAIAALPGVRSVDVFLVSEKAVIQIDRNQVELASIKYAVAAAGYSVAEPEDPVDESGAAQNFTRPVLILFGILFSVIAFAVVVGEWLGLFGKLTELIPWPIWLAIVIAAGYPVFLNVIRAALHKQVISHTLMTLGVLAAIAVGEWATALLIVFFMRVGDYVEHLTADRARHALKSLSDSAPRHARLEQGGREVELPVEQVHPGDLVIVRPGEMIPVDGDVIGGHATVDQSSITGESMPIEVGVGAQVFAASLAQAGSLRVCASRVGHDSTYGRIIHLVEEAEGSKAQVQRVADRFSAIYLPVVGMIAAMTFILSRNPLATAAVLVVACSCSFALATPIAMLASIGAAARHGLIIKGGRYLELLAQADVVLIDKTGTLTLGQPEITAIFPVPAWIEAEVKEDGSAMPDKESQEAELLRWTASAERYSEHPLAEAVRRAARQRDLELLEPEEFIAQPGVGLRARVDGRWLEIGNWRAHPGQIPPGDLASSEVFDDLELSAAIKDLQDRGQTLLYVWIDGSLAGVLAAGDVLRAEVPGAILALRQRNFEKIELLTGDHEQTAAAIAGHLDLAYRAGLLPEDKIRIVREYQAQGHTVVMIGDGINDAPALAQADVGIAIGSTQQSVAIEAAHIALMREDWSLIPEAVDISRRTMRVVKMNIGFTALYNLVGLSLAALGFLPPVIAAAAQSIPDLGILANSSRLLHQK